jgi:putative membrane protein
MVKRIVILSCSVLLALVALGCNRDEDPNHFAMEAAQGGLAEVQLGRLAVEHATNPAVKQFGQQMVDDHSKAGNELMQLAARKQMQLPTDVSAEQKETMTKLSKLSGADFDKAYVDAMVDDHEHDVKDFQAQANEGQDADLKAFAAKTLPTLQHHLQMIKDIKAKM